MGILVRDRLEVGSGSSLSKMNGSMGSARGGVESRTMNHGPSFRQTAERSYRSIAEITNPI
jgi:hypothetical protein